MTHRQLHPDRHLVEPETETEQLMMCLGYPIYEDNEIRDAITNAVEALPDKHRRIVEALFYQRASFSELGEILGCSKPHAWRLAQRAFEELRQQLLNNELIKEMYS